MTMVRVTAVLTVRDGEVIGYAIENSVNTYHLEPTPKDYAPRGLCRILDQLRLAIRRECAATEVDDHA